MLRIGKLAFIGLYILSVVFAVLANEILAMVVAAVVLMMIVASAAYSVPSVIGRIRRKRRAFYETCATEVGIKV